MSAKTATVAFEFEDHPDHRGDITTVVRRKPTAGAMAHQQERRDNVAQLQRVRPSGAPN